jgi:predicted DNA-binding transcriptional regulator AlpA
VSAAAALPGWPRGLREDMAAAYVGLSVSTIRAERAAGRFPDPVPLTAGRHVYLREDLDSYLDTKAGRTAPSMNGQETNPWDTAV